MALTKQAVTFHALASEKVDGRVGRIFTWQAIKVMMPCEQSKPALASGSSTFAEKDCLYLVAAQGSGSIDEFYYLAVSFGLAHAASFGFAPQPRRGALCIEAWVHGLFGS
jgi:hypothetical protein